MPEVHISGKPSKLPIQLTVKTMNTETEDELVFFRTALLIPQPSVFHFKASLVIRKMEVELIRFI